MEAQLTAGKGSNENRSKKDMGMYAVSSFRKSG